VFRCWRKKNNSMHEWVKLLQFLITALLLLDKTKMPHTTKLNYSDLR